MSEVDNLREMLRLERLAVARLRSYLTQTQAANDALASRIDECRAAPCPWCERSATCDGDSIAALRAEVERLRDERAEILAEYDRLRAAIGSANALASRAKKRSYTIRGSSVTTISRTNSFPSDPFTDEESKRIEDALRTALAAVTAERDAIVSACAPECADGKGRCRFGGTIQGAAVWVDDSLPINAGIVVRERGGAVAPSEVISRADHEREVREACIACVLACGDPLDQQWEHSGANKWWEAHVDRVLAERAKKVGAR